jgi:hypothetical protein
MLLTCVNTSTGPLGQPRAKYWSEDMVHRKILANILVISHRVCACKLLAEFPARVHHSAWPAPVAPHWQLESPPSPTPRASASTHHLLLRLALTAMVSIVGSYPAVPLAPLGQPDASAPARHTSIRRHGRTPQGRVARTEPPCGCTPPGRRRRARWESSYPRRRGTR